MQPNVFWGYKRLVRQIACNSVWSLSDLSKYIVWHIGASKPVSNLAVTIMNFSSDVASLYSSTIFSCCVLSMAHFCLNSQSSFAVVEITTLLASSGKYLSNSCLYWTQAWRSGVTINALKPWGATFALKWSAMSLTIFSTRSGDFKNADILADFLFSSSASSSVNAALSLNSSNALSRASLSTCTSTSLGSKCSGNVASSRMESWKV